MKFVNENTHLYVFCSRTCMYINEFTNYGKKMLNRYGFKFTHIHIYTYGKRRLFYFLKRYLFSGNTKQCFLSSLWVCRCLNFEIDDIGLIQLNFLAYLTYKSSFDQKQFIIIKKYVLFNQNSAWCKIEVYR